MHADAFDPYIAAHSPVHKLDPRVKLALTIAFLVSVASIPIGAWASLALLFASLLGVMIFSFVSPSRIFRRSIIALPFVLAALPLLFSVSGNPLFSVSIGNLSLQISSWGIVRFTTIFFKSWISVIAALLLSGVTNFQDLLMAMRTFRLPSLLVSIIGLMWRYLFILADEAIRLIRARDARSGSESGRRPGGTILWRAQVTGGMAGSLFVRGFDRADRVYASMLARGYDGEIRSLPVPPVPRGQSALLAAGIVWLGLLTLLGYLLR